jgi:large subunit ribosomal protein L6
MSRIGKQPVTLPPKVEVTLGADNHLTVKGPKGQLSMQVHPTIKVKKEDGKLIVERPDDERQSRALHGLTRALLNNMVIASAQASAAPCSWKALAIASR